MDLGIFIRTDERTAQDLARRLDLRMIEPSSEGVSELSFANGLQGFLYKHDFVADGDLDFPSYPIVMQFRYCGGYVDQVKGIFEKIVDSGFSAMLVENLQEKLAEVSPAG